MRLLFLADGRSPTALNWINYFVDRGDEVHLVSSFRCNPDLPLASSHFLDIAFSQFKTETTSRAQRIPYSHQGVGFGNATMMRLRTRLRQWFGPLTFPRASRQFHELVSQIQPDLVHAMRIPYEGMVAALGDLGCPLLISVWGNDFTLHAKSSPVLAMFTRQTMKRADALHTDCRRDQHLAYTWGFPENRPTVVLPGGGGIQLDLFYSLPVPAEAAEVNPPGFLPAIINPRGFRAYVRNDTFFKAIPLVLKQQPEARFICPAMIDEPLAHRWIEKLGISANVILLPRQDRSHMAELFRQAQAAVSLTTHDGTPNTLLEAMACGCLPIVSDLDSLREWITPGVNGLVVDPGDADRLAEAILMAVNLPDLRHRACELNRKIITERADYQKVMAQAAAFYHDLC